MLDGLYINEPMILWEPSEPKARETLYLEKDNTPLLSQHYQTWKHRLLNSIQHPTANDVWVMLSDLLVYLRTEVFDMPTCHSCAIQHIILKAGSDILPIELFVSEKSGVCRHFALTAYYFLETLRLEKILPINSVELIRKKCYANGSKGRHAWLSISTEENRSFHFDPFWGIMVDHDAPNAHEILQDIYGNF